MVMTPECGWSAAPAGRRRQLWPGVVNDLLTVSAFSSNPAPSTAGGRDGSAILYQAAVTMPVRFRRRLGEVLPIVRCGGASAGNLGRGRFAVLLLVLAASALLAAFIVIANWPLSPSTSLLTVVRSWTGRDFACFW